MTVIDEKGEVIHVETPFTYYLHGYQRVDFQRGTYQVASDVRAYAEAQGFLAGGVTEPEPDTEAPKARRARKPKEAD